jgi:rhamnosyl/mannosyltransferase
MRALRTSGKLSMRVLHIGKYFAPFAGGIENFMLDLVEATAPLGVTNSVLVHASDRRPQHSPGSETGHTKLYVERVATWGQFVYAPLAPGFGFALQRLLARKHPDLIHIHMPNTSAFWLLASRRARSIPWLVHWHSDVVGPGLDGRLRLLYPAYQPLEQGLLKQASTIIATSPPYLESSDALRPWQDKSRVVPLGIDENRLLDRETGRSDAHWSGSGRLRVLTVGRTTPYKGIDILVRAALDLPEAELIVAGDGDQRPRCERLVPAEASDRIRFVGSVSDGVRNQLMATCDLLVLPSRNRAEAFGMALLEAMALGKPTVATNVQGSGMSWVVDHGKTGWLVPPDDVDALSRCLAKLDRNRNQLARAGAAARQRFEQRFRIDAIARQIVSIYSESLPPHAVER